jgi:tetratricopeptide (TPR) repeat protein/predicted Ser/Thr protein kinase
VSELEAPHAVEITIAAASREGEGVDEPSVAITTRGRRFGRYLVLGTLGRGGMGVVVEAHDEQLDRTVAIKLLHLEATRRQQTRLLREAQALARLSHPNVVQVYDIGTIGERTFIAMELVRGRTLVQWRREPHPWRATVEVYLQAARGLAAAHAKGLVHRDFKPDNCILGEGGRVRVVDFGLARQVERPDGSRTGATEDELPVASGPTAGSGALRERVTQEGMVIGTMAYMSLEQLRGEPADARSDQYSFSASLFEALHGVRPYAGRTPAMLVGAMIEGRRTTPPKLRIPRRLRRAIDRGLSSMPAERWPSMDAFVDELEAIVRRHRWRSAVTLGLGVALGGGLALAGARQPEPCREADSTLDGAWDDVQRLRLARALARFGPVGDEDLLPRITERLDEYARAWGEMAHESCVATFVTRRQSEALFELRARCLERRQNRFASAVDELAGAGDPAALLQGAILPFKLPELAPCADVEALSERRVPPEDPALAEHHAELRRRLDRAEVLRESGRFGPALELAEATSRAAATQGDPSLRAEALACLGRIQAEGGSMRAAKDTLEQAIVEANRGAEDEVAARAWLSLLYATTLQGELAEAQHRALGATAAVERTGDELLHAWLLNDLGILASEARDAEKARGYLEQALELKVRALGERHVDVGIAWFNLGMMLSNAQQDGAAKQPIAEAMSIFEATVGPSHPLSVYAQSGLCNVELGLGDARAAAERCGHALARFESSPVSAMWESRVRFTMAKALWELGRRAEARDMAERAARVVDAEDPARARSVRAWLENRPP